MARTELSYRVFWSEQDGEWVGLCNEFPGISHLDTTEHAALEGIQDLATWAVGDLREKGRPMPWDASALPPVRSA